MHPAGSERIQLKEAANIFASELDRKRFAIDEHETQELRRPRREAHSTNSNAAAKMEYVSSSLSSAKGIVLLGSTMVPSRVALK